MRILFYAGVALWVLFEIANVYFIMPMPFSQRMQTIDAAYFLYTSRWVLRVLFALMILAGAKAAWRAPGWRRWLAPVAALVAAFVAYAVNFKMSADRMFLEPVSVTMKPAQENTVEAERLVVGIATAGDARAYPVHFIGYHHQVRDTLGGKPIMVSYCTVCRTGRVFDPSVDGQVETFRLVGMDHFNAMFEDKRTGSWWRQATGDAMVGPLKGKSLTEIPSQQVTLAQWLALYPHSLIMQPDSALRHKYSTTYDYETGKSRRALTGTDTISWRDKAWVVGLSVNGESKAYDWNRLRRERVINDVVGGTPVMLVLARDSVSFFAFERPDSTARFTLRGDSLVSGARSFALSGRGTVGMLRTLPASQEFWHSWRTFHPDTKTY